LLECTYTYIPMWEPSTGNSHRLPKPVSKQQQLPIPFYCLYLYYFSNLNTPFMCITFLWYALQFIGHFMKSTFKERTHGSIAVEALCYKPKDYGLIPNEVNGFSNWPNLSSSGVNSASNRNEYQKSSWGKWQLAHKADNLNTICEPTV
jgi:hypothetical protein